MRQQKAEQHKREMAVGNCSCGNALPCCASPQLPADPILPTAHVCLHFTALPAYLLSCPACRRSRRSARRRSRPAWRSCRCVVVAARVVPWWRCFLWFSQCWAVVCECCWKASDVTTCAIPDHSVTNLCLPYRIFTRAQAAESIRIAKAEQEAKQRSMSAAERKLAAERRIKANQAQVRRGRQHESAAANVDAWLTIHRAGPNPRNSHLPAFTTSSLCCRRMPWSRYASRACKRRSSAKPSDGPSGQPRRRLNDGELVNLEGFTRNCHVSSYTPFALLQSLT